MMFCLMANSKGGKRLFEKKIRKDFSPHKGLVLGASLTQPFLLFPNMKRQGKKGIFRVGAKLYLLIFFGIIHLCTFLFRTTLSFRIEKVFFSEKEIYFLQEIGSFLFS